MELTRGTDGAKQSQDNKTSHSENIQGDPACCASFIYAVCWACVSALDASLCESIQAMLGTARVFTGVEACMGTHEEEFIKVQLPLEKGINYQSRLRRITLTSHCKNTAHRNTPGITIDALAKTKYLTMKTRFVFFINPKNKIQLQLDSDR